MKIKKGFTLIELLVVIAIIGILATVVILNVSKAISKARDAKRKDDISQIARAVKMYYVENGKYPVFSASNTSDYSYSLNLNWRWLNTSLQPSLSNLPKDSKNLYPYYYVYRTTGTSPFDWFTIYAVSLENTSDSQTCSKGRIFSYFKSGLTYYSCTANNNLLNAFGISSDKN